MNNFGHCIGLVPQEKCRMMYYNDYIDPSPDPFLMISPVDIKFWEAGLDIFTPPQPRLPEFLLDLAELPFGAP